MAARQPLPPHLKHAIDVAGHEYLIPAMDFVFSRKILPILIWLGAVGVLMIIQEALRKRRLLREGKKNQLEWTDRAGELTRGEHGRAVLGAVRI